MKEIVSCSWLKENLNEPNLILLDASLESTVDGNASTLANKTIPFAIRFDLKQSFVDKTSPFPNTIPKPEGFENACRKLGINHNSKIIVFDNLGVYSSPRVWWLFTIMGHQNIAVLDGGLPSWVEKGYPTKNNYFIPSKTGNFKANFNRSLLITFQEITQNLTHKNFLVVDARSSGRFNGTEEEPRKHLQSGSIKNSVNIPYQEVLNNGKFKDKNTLHDLFTEKCNGEKELVFSCGSGLTACIIMLACQIGYGNSKKVYDGSWTEWAELNKLTTSS